MKKRIPVLSMLIALILSFTACSSSEPSSSKPFVDNSLPAEDARGVNV